MNNIYTSLLAVMGEVGAVRKNEKNQAQGFNFRGIDSVVNAVYPALVKHKVLVHPNLISADYDSVVIGSGKTMGAVRVVVEYTFIAEDGSSLASRVAAESFDSGDKATAKAMSVAFRTCLLQTLCLPTDETDPDHDVYDRAAPPTPRPKVAGPKDQPFQPQREYSNPMPAGGLTKAQRVWVEKQAGPDTVKRVSDILGRTINSLDDVTADDVRVILPALAGKE